VPDRCCKKKEEGSFWINAPAPVTSHDAIEPLLSLALESQLFIHSQKAILNIKSAKIKEWFEIINSHIFFKTPIKKKSPDFFYMVQVGYTPKKGEKNN
jgi:hypothetical protein